MVMGKSLRNLELEKLGIIFNNRMLKVHQRVTNFDYLGMYVSTHNGA